MPFTPFHMGPGILVKSLLQGSFSLMVFGWSQIVMDVQPLVAIVSGVGKLHGFIHTYIGATLIAFLSAVTGKYLARWALVTIFSVAPVVLIRWWVAFLSAFIGAYSHVVLDSIMHNDIQPLLPLSSSNVLLGFISISALHKFCLYSGLVGAVLYFVVGKFQSKHNNALRPTCLKARALNAGVETVRKATSFRFRRPMKRSTSRNALYSTLAHAGGLNLPPKSALFEDRALLLQLRIQCLVRALEFELVLEAVELALLATTRVSRGPRGLGFERAMHAARITRPLRVEYPDALCPVTFRVPDKTGSGFPKRVLPR
jgi:hypothetical protein